MNDDNAMLLGKEVGILCIISIQYISGICFRYIPKTEANN